MNIDINTFGTCFLQKKAPALDAKEGGADIGNRYVLGLRLKPAPVFHFLGVEDSCKKSRDAALRGTCLKRTKSEQTAALLGRLSWGVAFCE